MKIQHVLDLLIGLDRSDRKADLHIINTRSGQRRSVLINTAPEALREFLLQLRQDHPNAKIGLCLEQPAGHLISFLESYDWITLYPINPIMLQKFRETFVTSRAKDDARDAYYLAELLLTHPDKLTAWAPEDSATRAVQLLAFHRRAVINERTTLTNRLQGLLKQYFPQALLLCGDDLWRPLATAFLLRWPSLSAVKKSKTATLKQFYHLQGSRSEKLIKERLDLISQAVPVIDDAALINSFVLRIQLLARELQAVQKTIQQFDQELAQAYGSHPDKPIFSSFPGAGPVLGARLLASTGAQRDRFTQANQLQCYSAIAPVTKRSGGSSHIHRRYLCPKFHRQSYHEYAAESILWCRWAAAYYLQQRNKGSSHHTAVRALAYKWQRVLFRCWQDGKPYDDTHYEAVLRKRNSPIVKLFDSVELGKSPVKNPAKKT